MNNHPFTEGDTVRYYSWLPSMSARVMKVGYREDQPTIFLRVQKNDVFSFTDEIRLAEFPASSFYKVKDVTGPGIIIHQVYEPLPIQNKALAELLAWLFMALLILWGLLWLFLR